MSEKNKAVAWAADIVWADLLLCKGVKILLSTRRLLRIRLFFEGAIVGIFTGVIVAVNRFFLALLERSQNKKSPSSSKSN